VLFRAFGDSSLDFELRCFIRDVDKRLITISDLNLAIDAAFREAGIEIPFPQRDVHFRNGPLPDTQAAPGEPPAPAA
jgi:potassium efflux system protein